MVRLGCRSAKPEIPGFNDHKVAQKRYLSFHHSKINQNIKNSWGASG